MDKILFSSRLSHKRKSKYKNQTLFAKEYIERFPPKRRDDAGGNEGNYNGILGTIKNYENPNYSGSPNLEIVDNMCKILGCDVDYLLGKIDYETHDLQFVCDYTGLSESSVHFLNDLSTEKQRMSGWREKNILRVMDLLLDESKADENLEYWNRIQAFMFAAGGDFTLSLTAGSFSLHRDDVLSTLLTLNNAFLMNRKVELERNDVHPV